MFLFHPLQAFRQVWPTLFGCYAYPSALHCWLRWWQSVVLSSSFSRLRRATMIDEETIEGLAVVRVLILVVVVVDVSLRGLFLSSLPS